MPAIGPDWYTWEGSNFSRASFTNVWIIALSTYGVGDIVTSIALIWFSPAHVEGNPLIALSISLFGGGGYLALKLLSLFGCLGISLIAGFQDRDPLLFYGPPLLLAAVGAVSTVYNLWIML